MKFDAYTFWGEHHSLYRLVTSITFLGRERMLRKEAVRSLKLKKGDTVLYLACGTGLNFPYLRVAVGSKGVIIGLDYSSEMLEAAKVKFEKEGWQNIELI